jgi:AsmA protein
MKKALWIVVAVVVVIVLVVIAIPLFLNVNQFRPDVETKLTTALGRKVTIGNLGLSLFAGELTADNIAIADDPAFSTSPFIQAKSLKVGVEMQPLIFNRVLRIRSITLKQPQVDLLHSAAGAWNFSSLGKASGSTAPTQKSEPATTPKPGAGKAPPPAPAAGSSATPDLTIQKLNVVDGRVTVGSPNQHKTTYEAVNLTANNISYTSAFPFSLQAKTPAGGQLNLQGTAGPVNQEDTSLTPLSAKVVIKSLDLASTGFIPPDAGLAGHMDFDGTVRSDGRSAVSDGTATLTKFKLVKNGSLADGPVAVDYASTYNLKEQAGQLTKGLIHLGKSAVALRGNYDLKPVSPLLHMNVDAASVPVQDIESVLPALGVVLPSGSKLESGTAATHLALEGPADRLVTTGSVNLTNAKLAGFNLASKLSALSAFTGMKGGGADTVIQLLSTNIRVAPEGIRSDNLQLIVPDMGTVTGAGTIAPDNTLNFHMLAKLSNAGAVGGVMQLAGLKGGAKNGIPFMIQGTTSNPRFVPDVSGMLQPGALSSAAGGILGKGKGGNLNQQNLGGVLGGLLGKKKK